MEEIWSGVLKELEVPDEIISKWWEKIVAQYSESERVYHNIDKCLPRKFKIYNELIKGNIAEPSAFVLAIFFQHFEYGTKIYGECTDKNVAHLKDFFKDAGIEHEGLLTSVVALLGAARTSGGWEEGDAAYFQDLDLAELGSPPDEYRQFIEEVERENSHTPSHLYRSLRLKLLQTLLLIPKIFSTEIFYEKYEAMARENIQAEIEEVLK